MWELDCKESWAPKNWCFWTVVLEKTLESPLECKEIQSVHSKGYHPWLFIGRTDAKAETPILWPPHAKSWLIGKDSDAGKIWGQEEKGTTEDEMAGWHHRLDGHEFGWTPGVGDGQGGLACCIHGVTKSWTRLMTELNWRLGILLWGLKLSLQYKNFFGIIFLQFVYCPPRSSIMGLMSTSSKRTYATCHASHGYYCQSPPTHGRPLLTCASQETLKLSKADLAQSFA